MNSDKLAKAVKRELTRNLKKTILLGVMCLVALYFWAPLLFGWLPGGSAPADSAEAAPAAQSTLTVATSDSAATSPTPQIVHDWRQISGWMKQDSYTRSATLELVRDPFALATVTAAGPEQSPAHVNAGVEVTPQQLDLVLGSTIVGGGMRIATINGKTYGIHSQVTVGGDEKNESGAPKAGAVQFVLTEVHPGHVVLERQGKQYLLHLQRPTANDDLQIVRREG